MPKYSRTAAMAALAMASVAVVSPTAVAECGQPDPTATDQVIEQLTDARAEAGLPALRADARLARTAAAHARRMARAGEIFHDNLMAWANGRAVAQNVAYGSSGTEAYFAMWNSPPHRTAMLARRYRMMGIGAARACDGTVMVSMNLAAPRH